jgi:hypothetical protein
MDTIQWRDFRRDQTPENIRIDQNGMRAWGYRRFRLEDLLQFARRQKTTVDIQAPHIILETSTQNYDEIEDEDPDLSAFVSRETKSVCTRILSRLKSSVGESKARLCVRVVGVMSTVPNSKLSFRYTAPKGANGPVCMMFRITNHRIDYKTLESISNSEGVKNVMAHIDGGIILLKVTIRHLI